ncbi:MAG: hypothetical protein ACO1OB_05920 [Archangium sp.]
MRIQLLVLLTLSGCAGFKPVDRGDWRLVYADPAQRGGESMREVITRDDSEKEVAEGNRRTWEAPAGYAFPKLQQTDTVGLKVGEVAGFVVDEATDAQLYADGDAVKLFWGPLEKKDGWKGDIDVTTRESTLYVVGKQQGTATLRVVNGSGQKDIPVTVK